MFAKIAAALAASIPGAFLAVITRLFSRPLVEWILARLVVEGLQYLAERTATTVDDEIVERIRRELGATEPPPVGGG